MNIRRDFLPYSDGTIDPSLLQSNTRHGQPVLRYIPRSGPTFDQGAVSEGTGWPRYRQTDLQMLNLSGGDHAAHDIASSSASASNLALTAPSLEDSSTSSQTMMTSITRSDYAKAWHDQLTSSRYPLMIGKGGNGQRYFEVLNWKPGIPLLRPEELIQQTPGSPSSALSYEASEHLNSRHIECYGNTITLYCRAELLDITDFEKSPSEEDWEGVAVEFWIESADKNDFRLLEWQDGSTTAPSRPIVNLVNSADKKQGEKDEDGRRRRLRLRLAWKSYVKGTARPKDKSRDLKDSTKWYVRAARSLEIRLS
jgi:hypothetical protein